MAGQALSTLELCNTLWTAGDWLGRIRNVAYNRPHYAVQKRGRTIRIRARKFEIKNRYGRVVISRTPNDCIVDTGVDYVDCGVRGYTLDTYAPAWKVQWIVVQESTWVHDSLTDESSLLRAGATYPMAAKGLRLWIPEAAVDSDTYAILHEGLRRFEQYQQARLMAQLAAQQRQYRGW